MNPYLAEALKFPCRCPYKWDANPEHDLGCTLCTDPATAFSRSSDWRRRAELRWTLRPQYAFAIPNASAIETIVRWSPIIEIGAGTGYWASLIAAAGGDIVAYDVRPGHNDWTQHDPYFPVKRGGHAAVTRHAARTLFLCWPPMTDMAERVLYAYRGRRLIYVGEHAGGCCASDHFFDMLTRRWTEVGVVDIPQWSGIHDALWLYERRR